MFAEHDMAEKVRRILRLRSTTERTGTGKTTHYEHIKKGLMTPPVAISERLCGWPEDEVEAINSARIAGWSDSQIRELVAELVSRRNEAVSTVTRSGGAT